MDADQLRVEQALADVQDLNGLIVVAGRTLCSAATEGREEPPTDADRRWAAQRIRELQIRRNEIEERLIRTIEYGIGRKRTSRF